MSYGAMQASYGLVSGLLGVVWGELVGGDLRHRFTNIGFAA